MLEADVEVDRRDFTVRASLTVAPGERLALFGPSGAGKTTLLEVIAGLVAPRRGRIALAGRVLTETGGPASPSAGGSGGSSPRAGTAGGSGGSSPRPGTVPPWQRRVGLLRQDPGLFPHLSVRDNLLYAAPRRAGWAGARGRAGARDRGNTVGGADAGGRAGPGLLAELTELSEVLGIAGLLSAMPAGLSGGQAHRVALGRLLLAHCDALLLDEPYTGLDASLRRTLTDLVISLVGQRRVPSILVAHELAETQAFADRLAVLDRGQILQVGSPSEVVLRPASRRVAELVGYTGFVPVPAAVAGAAPACGPGAGQGQSEIVAGVHPDRVRGGRHPDRGLVLPGTVTGCRPAGALWEVTIRVSGSRATAVARLPEAAPNGQEMVLTVLDPPCFGPDGTAVGIGESAGVPR